MVVLLMTTTTDGKYLGERHERIRWEDLRPEERIKEKIELKEN